MRHALRSGVVLSGRFLLRPVLLVLVAMAFSGPTAAHAANGEQGDMCLTDGQCQQGLVCDPILSGGLGICGQPSSIPQNPFARRKVDHRLCNSNLDCPQNQACDTIGLCTTGDCAFSCGPMQVCRPLHGCVSVECTSDGHCSGVCIDNSCAECRGDGDCPDRHLCRDNECREVECTRQQHCRSDQLCTQNSCQDRCEPGSKWVTAPGFPVCATCVSTSAPANCSDGPVDCPIDQVCAEGHCIDSCSGVRGDVRALRREIARLSEVVVAVDGRPPKPGDPCLSCTRRITTAPLGAMLGRAGVPQTVTVELVDRSGRVIADLGTHKPSRGGFPTLEEGVTVVPKAPLDLAKNPCGYSVRMTNQRGEQLASQGVCLTGS